jgi:hypothetical protein
MPLDTKILAGDDYLSLADHDEHAERLQRTLKRAVSRCESYTGRTVQPMAATAPFLLPLAGAPVVEPATMVHTARASTNLLRVPDCRGLLYLDVLDGHAAGRIARDAVEPITWGNSLTAVWLRLPFAPVGRPRVAVNGLFGMDPPPADLEDSIYAYAATRWREADANFGTTGEYDDGSTFTVERRIPTIVRGVWDEYKVPEPAMSVVSLRGA